MQMVNPIFIWCNLFLITLSNPGSASLSSPFRLVPGPIRAIPMSGGDLEPTSVMWRAWWRHTHQSLPGTSRNEVNLNHHLVSRTRDVELKLLSFCFSQDVVKFIVTLSLYLLMIFLTFSIDSKCITSPVVSTVPPTKTVTVCPTSTQAAFVSPSVTKPTYCSGIDLKLCTHDNAHGRTCIWPNLKKKMFSVVPSRGLKKLAIHWLGKY